MITQAEIQTAELCLELTRRHGAQQARVSISKSEEDLIATLNGEVDKVTHCADRSLSVALFVDGRFGSFSTNKLDPESLDVFIAKSVDIVRMLAPDPCRKLPEPERTVKDATTGNELELLDPFYPNITADIRRKTALAACITGDRELIGDWKLISEEGEYSDSIYDSLIMDTNGLRCFHSENSFDYGVEVTIEADGEKYSSYDWDSASRFSELKAASCGAKALDNAIGKVGAQPLESGRYNAVVESRVASKLVSPLLRAINGYALQQNNSFLMDSLGKKVLPEGLTIVDLPRIKGQNCSKYFDSEGVATKDMPIVEKGVVSSYFINSYMSGKLGMDATIEEATRPKVLPWPKTGLDRDAIMKLCGDGILITDFNGGNSNPATGDFSYGIEGYAFRDGKIVAPLSEMLMTGNFLSLWEGLIACGDDCRSCMSKLIPTLAFSNVDFSG